MRTHPLNVSYLVVGLVFVGIALSWALHAADVIASADLGWLFPLSLVLAGTIGLVAFVAAGRTRRTPPPPGSPGDLETAYDSHLDLDTDLDKGLDTDTQGDPR